MSNKYFNNPDRARQLITFSGYLPGKLSATDNDFTVVYHNQCYILGEVKVSGIDLPYGQNLAFERMSDDLGTVKPTIFIVAEHDYPVEEDIILKDCNVRKFRFNRKWNVPPQRITVKQLTEYFLKGVEQGRITFTNIDNDYSI